MAWPLRDLWFGFPYPGFSQPLEDSEGSLLFLAVTSSNVHPTGFAGLAIGWCHFVVNRRDACRPQGVDVPQWALVMATALGISFWASAGPAVTSRALDAPIKSDERNTAVMA